MLKVTAVWTGFIGGPGYTNFYFGVGLDGIQHTQTEANTLGARVSTFFNTLSSLLPATVNVAVQPGVQNINPSNGELVNEFLVSPTPAARQGTGVGAYSAPNGAHINWRTNAVADGKKLRGRTFLVPLVSTSYEANGTLASATIQGITNACDPLVAPALTTGEALVIWHRPRKASEGVEARTGSVGRVVSYNIPDKSAVLRSRRD